MKCAGRERSVHAGLLEDLRKILRRTGTARCDQRDATAFAGIAELRRVVAMPHAVVIHAVEHDLAGAAILCFPHPVERLAPGVPRLRRIAGVLVHAPASRVAPAVDADDDALGAEAPRQLVDQGRALERG